MSSVEVKEQVSLPLSKCLELVLSGIKYRLFRAGITVTIIALAVTFLMVMLTQSLVARKVADSIDRSTAPRKLLDRWVSRLSTPLTETELTGDLAVLASSNDPRYQELKAWGKVSDDAQMQQLQDIARTQLSYMNEFFNVLDEGARRHLVGTAQGPAIFAYLSDRQHYDTFITEMPKGERRLPGKIEDFRSFLDQWEQTRPQRQAILKGHEQALVPVKAHLGNTMALDKLAQPDQAFLDVLAKSHFQMTPDQLALLKQEAQQKAAETKIRATLSVPMAKRQIANKLNIKPTDTDFQVLFSYASGSSGAAAIAEMVASAEYADAAAAQGVAPLNLTDKPLPACALKPKRESFPKDAAGDEPYKTAMAEYDQKAKQYNEATKSFQGPNAARIQAVAEAFIHNQSLAETEEIVKQAAGSGGVGFSGRTLWLIIVSFLVCVVGIANAMLMSVTERFREIATMKCLGATDGFIMINFIMESVMQGVAGSVIGAVLGLILGVLRAWFSYGAMTWTSFPLSDVLVSMGIGMAVGVVVSALAAVYPAYVAARLAPMEAMRIE